MINLFIIQSLQLNMYFNMNRNHDLIKSRSEMEEKECHKLKLSNPINCATRAGNFCLMDFGIHGRSALFLNLETNECLISQCSNLQIN